MVQENTYQRPSLLINGKEVLSDISGTVNFTGNSQLNKLSVKINSPELQNAAVHNKIIELYLNNGSDDSVPIFRGYINDFTPNDTGISLSALDMRTKLTGSKGLKLTLTDENNYDGYTLGQFIFSFLKEFIDDVSIGVDMLSDTSPPVFMTGKRGEDIDVYSFMTEKVKESIDSDTDFRYPSEHFIDVYEGGNNSSLIIRKDKLLTTLPTYTFSYADGLIKYSYKRRLPANAVTYEGRKFSYTNNPQGISSMQVEKQDSPAETRNLALRNILIAQQQTDEINITVSKAFDVHIGDIVFLDLDEEDIAGNHRVQSKTITFGKSASSCSLKLNKKPITIKKYI